MLQEEDILSEMTNNSSESSVVISNYAVLYPSNDAEYVSSFCDNLIKKIDSKEVVRFKGAGMTSRQTQLLLTAVAKCLSGNNLSSYYDSSNIPIYIGSAQTHYEKRTIKAILKICLNNNTVNLHDLGKKINSLPPLDAIKLLPTSSTHFVSQTNDFHGKGSPMFCGTLSSAVAIYNAYTAVKNGEYDVAIVASSDSNIQPHELYSSQARITSHLIRNKYNLSWPLVEAAGCIIIENRKKAIDRCGCYSAKLNYANIVFEFTEDMLPTENGFLKSFSKKNSLFSSSKIIITFMTSKEQSNSPEYKALKYLKNKIDCITFIDYNQTFGYAGSASSITNLCLTLDMEAKNKNREIRSVNDFSLGGFYSSIIIEV